jgi:hypothetical protein
MCLDYCLNIEILEASKRNDIAHLSGLCYFLATLQNTYILHSDH